MANYVQERTVAESDYDAGIFLEGMRQTVTNTSQYSFLPGRKLAVLL
jgi:hypothetical protein